MKRKSILLIFILVIIINSIPLVAAGSTLPYSAASSWAQAELQKADQYGLIPNSLKGSDMRKHITREEFAELAVKVYEKTTNKTAVAAYPNPFTDTANPEILKAYNLGITTGLSAKIFAPNDSTNREQVATMLSRLIRLIAPNADFSIAGAPSFTDQRDISSWALEHVLFMSKMGIIKGESGKFMPRPITDDQKAKGYAITTREQAIAMSVRIHEQYSTEEATEAPKGSSNIVGKWRYHFSAGVYGLSFMEVDFYGDGTFNYAMVVVVSTGSGFSTYTTGRGASSQGNYKITGDKILFYNVIGGKCQENIYYDNLYEYIERASSVKDITLDNMEFIFSIDSSAGNPILTLNPVKDYGPDSLGYGLFTIDNPLELIK